MYGFFSFFLSNKKIHFVFFVLRSRKGKQSYTSLYKKIIKIHVITIKKQPSFALYKTRNNQWEVGDNVHKHESYKLTKGKTTTKLPNMNITKGQKGQTCIQG